MNQPLVILGCTACGKSDLAEALAVSLPGTSAAHPATILAIDSMQVYRGMDIGTAKPTQETRARIPHAMLDVADPWESYSAARFVADAQPILEAHLRESRPIILVAGTILYLRALLEGLFDGPSADSALRADLEKQAGEKGTPALHAELQKVDSLAASRIHPNDLRRIIRAMEVYQLTGTPISTLQTQWNQEHPAIEAKFIGIEREREALNRRINARIRQMMYPKGGGGGKGEGLEGKHGMAEGASASCPSPVSLLDEVRGLAAHPRGLGKEAASGVGYRQLLDHLAGRCSLDDAVEQIKIQTRHLAKLQRTWLKRFPQVHWIAASDVDTPGSITIAALRHLSV